MEIKSKTELLKKIFELGKELENSNNNTESMMIVHDMESSIDKYVDNLFPKKNQFVDETDTVMEMKNLITYFAQIETTKDIMTKIIKHVNNPAEPTYISDDLEHNSNIRLRFDILKSIRDMVNLEIRRTGDDRPNPLKQ
ncbi:MAG: hypothetical protein GY827_04540 [Cytophagales bacterium]|nr:hypothetical protein [Cytophagales bacterium]